MKRTTLCFSIVDGKVLLAMKKRGFGMGKWNGPGGKIEVGESIEDACRREMHEETGVVVPVLESRGTIEFVFDGKPDWDNECHIFIAPFVEGEAVETEEMKPCWFAFSDIPYDEMWEDDVVWLPRVLAGETVNLRFFFTSEGKLVRHEELR